MNENIYKLAENRILIISEDITHNTMDWIIPNLLYLDQISRNPITIYINTNGGVVTDGLAIVDAMDSIKSPIKTICLGKAYSMGSVILSAGTPGMRYCAKFGTVMMHSVLKEFPISQNSDAADSEYHMMNMYNDTLLSILSKNTNKPITILKKDMEKDFYLTSQQALNYGIIDAIM